MATKAATGDQPKKRKRKAKAAPGTPLAKAEAKVSRAVGNLAKARHELREAKKAK